MGESKPVQTDQGLTLSRWSRLKRAAAEEQAGLSSARVESVDALPASEKGRDEIGPDSAVNAVSVSRKFDDLPPISAISLAEDFTPFMQSTVPQALKRQALKALFKEPHFNVMDGLDIYIDDYTVFEPISPEVMATLSSWKTIMNPPEQVVTPGGYAVDVESAEGKAVLAARAEQAEQSLALEPAAGDAQAASPRARDVVEGEGDDAAELTSLPVDSASSHEPFQLSDVSYATAAEGAKQHIKYGKRVGDFSASAHVAAEQAALDAASASANPDPTASAATKNITQ